MGPAPTTCSNLDQNRHNAFRGRLKELRAKHVGERGKPFGS
ncbi:MULTISPECIES: hypothetical protein [Streptomyces]|nr:MULTISPECIES: hypothetical protein [Streptomyces]MCX4431637.1 hypothetical protein [Streptomyces mirabilis]